MPDSVDPSFITEQELNKCDQEKIFSWEAFSMVQGTLFFLNQHSSCEIIAINSDILKIPWIIVMKKSPCKKEKL